MPLFEKVKCRNYRCQHNINYTCNFYAQKDKAKKLCPIQDVVDGEVENI
jgi:uncharacterized protein CbrC (UPF0167 family)